MSLSILVCKGVKASKSDITLISKSMYDVNFETSFNFCNLSIKSFFFLFGELNKDFSLKILSLISSYIFSYLRSKG